MPHLYTGAAKIDMATHLYHIKATYRISIQVSFAKRDMPHLQELQVKQSDLH